MYACNTEIWDALKAACEAPDMETTRLLIESAGIIVSTKDMTICYDERGNRKSDLVRGLADGRVCCGAASSGLGLPSWLWMAERGIIIIIIIIINNNNNTNDLPSCM